MGEPLTAGKGMIHVCVRYDNNMQTFANRKVRAESVTADEENYLMKSCVWS